MDRIEAAIALLCLISVAFLVAATSLLIFGTRFCDDRIRERNRRPHAPDPAPADAPDADARAGCGTRAAPVADGAGADQEA